MIKKHVMKQQADGQRGEGGEEEGVSGKSRRNKEKQVEERSDCPSCSSLSLRGQKNLACSEITAPVCPPLDS